MTFEKIKEKIYNKVGLLQYGFILLFHGKKLEEYKTLEELNIKPESSLDVILNN